MIYLIDFNGCSGGMYKRSETGLAGWNSRLSTFEDGQIFITEPDLEAYATIVNERERPNFINITIGDVIAGRMSIDAMKITKHYILIGDTWVLLALAKKVHSHCFELSYGGGERMWTHSFGMGEPMEE